MGGARAGDQESAVAGPSRRRRVLVAGGIVVVLLAIFAGPELTNDFWSEYPRETCKGYGVGGALLDEPPAHASPEAAVEAFAQWATRLGPQPVPADGWQEYRGRWVRDMGDGTYYEVDVHEYPNGWAVDGDFMICGR